MRIFMVAKDGFDPALYPVNKPGVAAAGVDPDVKAAGVNR